MTKFSNKLKNPVLAHFGPFFPILRQKRNLPRKFSCHAQLHEFLAPCQFKKKTNDAIPRKHLDRRTERRKEGRKEEQTLFYGTLLATTEGPIKCFSKTSSLKLAYT